MTQITRFPIGTRLAGTAATSDIGTGTGEVIGTDEAKNYFGLKFKPSVTPTISSDFTRNEHKLYEQYGLEPKSITQMYDVERASTATYVDATGRIRTVGVNEPRIDFSSGQGRLLVEEARTNLLLASEYWDMGYPGVGWNSGSSFFRSMVPGDHPQRPDLDVCYFGPNNGVSSIYNADEFEPSSTVAINSQCVPLDNGGNYIAYADYKAVGDVDEVRFLLDPPYYENASVGGTLYLHGNGGVRTNDYSAGDIFADQFLLDSSPLGNGWYRCMVGFTTNQPISYFRFRGFPYKNGNPVVGDGVSGLLGTMAQLEAGSTPSSYIYTTSDTKTRAADNVSRVLGDEFNNDEGTLFLEFGGEIVPSSKSMFNSIYTLSDGTLNNRITAIVRRSGIYRFFIVANGVQQDSVIDLSLGQINKLALVYSKANNTCATYVDGVLRNSGMFVGFSSNLTEFVLGASRPTGGFNIGRSEFKGVTFYPKALSQSECEELTKI